MKRVVFNQKGGVGKSSITCNLAAISAEMGYSTLVIDLDVQGNSSMYLGHDIHSEEAIAHGTSVANIFKQKRGLLSNRQPANTYVQETDYENLYLLPASVELESMEKDLESRYKIYQLRKALDQLEEHYDRIYIDTPPNFNFYSKSALIATDTVLIPFDCDSFSKQALYNLIDNMMELKEDHNENLRIEGVVINQFNTQATLPAQLVQELKEEEMPVLDCHIGSSVKMKESHYQRRPLIHMARSHKLTQQFIALFEQIEDLAPGSFYQKDIDDEAVPA
ncbi:MAG: ParA family protein [Pseudomonadales bacterium]|nr:ParA family protein [Pseudomonadales bacterium]